MAEEKNVGVRGEGLSVRRGGRVLFRDLSFAAKPGDYVEVCGANGVGKTSLLRVVAGFLRPSAGRIIVTGAEEPALAFHYIGHLNALKGGASVRAHMRYWAGLFGAESAFDAAASRLGIAPLLDLPTRVLSQGQQRRTALSRLLIAPRPVWLLDEPAAGLDSSGRALVGELVAAHCATGGVVLAAVHEPLGPAPAQSVTLT
jgi:heme exporter protein A